MTFFICEECREAPAIRLGDNGLYLCEVCSIEWMNSYQALTQWMEER
jgi:hypothetical protein